MKSNKTEYIQLRVTPEFKNDLKAACLESGKDMSDYVREACVHQKALDARNRRNAVKATQRETPKASSLGLSFSYVEPIEAGPVTA